MWAILSTSTATLCRVLEPRPMGEIMHIAVRQSVTAGVALVGAGAIVLSPIQPVTSPMSFAHSAVSLADVDLVAAYNPIAPWVQIFTDSATNLSQIGTDWLSNPFPVARQLGTNLIGYGSTVATAIGATLNGTYGYLTDTLPAGLSTAFTELANGQPSAAATELISLISFALFQVGGGLFPLLDLPPTIANNVAAVVSTAFGLGTTILPVVVGVLGLIDGPIQSVGDSAQAALDALKAGDVTAAVGAVLDTVPKAINVFLNGGTLQGQQYFGLLSPGTGFSAGLLATLTLTIPRAIAAALGAPAAAASAALGSRTPASAGAESTDGQANADGASGTAAESTGSAPASSTPQTVKDGNKVEPARTGQAKASSPRAVAGKHAASSSKGKATAGKSSSTGRSAR